MATQLSPAAAYYIFNWRENINLSKKKKILKCLTDFLKKIKFLTRKQHPMNTYVSAAKENRCWSSRYAHFKMLSRGSNTCHHMAWYYFYCVTIRFTYNHSQGYHHNTTVHDLSSRKYFVWSQKNLFDL